MTYSKFALASMAFIVGLLIGCSSSNTTSPEALPDAASPETAGHSGSEDIVGTVVRFESGEALVDVTIDRNSPASRDFLSMLPLALDLQEFNGREKIGYLPRKLNHQGTPGSDPEDGDFIYYTPWGNLGFYYNTVGVGYSDATLHIGVYDASVDELNRLEGPGVTVAVLK